MLRYRGHYLSTHRKRVSHLQKLKQKDEEIKKLKGALHLFINNESSPQPIEVDKEQDELMHSGSEDEEMNVEIDAAEGDQEEEEGEEGQGEGVEPRKPLFDMQTGLYFCTDCLAEIDEGLCILCGGRYGWQEASIFSCTQRVLEIKHILTGRPFAKHREHGESGHSLRS